MTYDTTRYPMQELILEATKKHFPKTRSLETVHEDYLHELSGMAKIISHELHDGPFYDYLDDIIYDWIQEDDVLIQRFVSLRYVLPDQDKSGKVLQFHQGRWVGNGMGMGTCWIPWTEAYDSNSLQVIELDKSREITRNAVRNQWDYDQLETACREVSRPVVLSPGQAHLFNQEIVHGQIENRTGKTRVSSDIRILFRDGQTDHRWPGSFFRPIRQNWTPRSISIPTDDVVITYCEFNGERTRHIDRHWQVLATRDYLKRIGREDFPHHHSDNMGLGSVYLQHLLDQGMLDHVVLCTIHNLPADWQERDNILQSAASNGVKLHFALEDMVFQGTEDDFYQTHYIRDFSKNTTNPVMQLREELGFDRAN